jgi:hypothetical protein
MLLLQLPTVTSACALLPKGTVLQATEEAAGKQR